MEGCSLTGVLLANQLCWTATVKLKDIAGIALGVQFSHSLGMIHGSPNSSTILFDEAHRIQITDFDLIHLEMHGTECGIGSAVFLNNGACRCISVTSCVFPAPEVPDLISEMTVSVQVSR
jgi:serine/threonine protein kinase